MLASETDNLNKQPQATGQTQKVCDNKSPYEELLVKNSVATARSFNIKASQQSTPFLFQTDSRIGLMMCHPETVDF